MDVSSRSYRRGHWEGRKVLEKKKIGQVILMFFIKRPSKSLTCKDHLRIFPELMANPHFPMVALERIEEIVTSCYCKNKMFNTSYFST